MMIRHHQGAVEMSEDLRRAGNSADARSLGATIERGQTAEIGVMRGLLATPRASTP